VLHSATSLKTGECSEQSEIDLSVKTNKLIAMLDRASAKVSAKAFAFLGVEPSYNFMQVA